MTTVLANDVYLRTNAFSNNRNIIEVDCSYTRWKNNSLSYSTYQGENYYGAFSYCKNLTTVSNINNNVTNMAHAFYMCNNLTNPPEIPNSVTDISSLFQHCRNLSNFPIVPNSVVNMGDTYCGCNKIVNALSDVPPIPNSVTNLFGTFSQCWNLVNAPVIPNNVTEFGACFYYCPKLVDAPVIPNGITNMSMAYFQCSNLVNVPEIPESVKTMRQTFTGCYSLVNAPVIPSNVTIVTNLFNSSGVQNNVFIKSEKITDATDCFVSISRKLNVYIPYKTTTNEILNLYGWSGEDWSSGETLYFYTDTDYVNTLGNDEYVDCAPIYYSNGQLVPDAFAWVSKWDDYIQFDLAYNGEEYYLDRNSSIDTNALIPAGSLSKTYQSFIGAGYNDTYKYGVHLRDYDSYNKINSDYNYSASGDSITLQNYIGSDTNVITPKYNDINVYVANTCYSNNRNIVSVDLNNASTDGSGFFINCRNLATVTNINENTTGLFSWFWYCYNMTEAPYIPDNVYTLWMTFDGCSGIRNVPHLPSSLDTMPSAFAGCSNLVNIPDIPYGVTDMRSTFSGCSSLVNAPALPNTVSDISGVFSGCSSLVNAPVIPNSINGMSYVFSGCHNLITAPVIPNSITDMEYTFESCYKITDMPNIPNSVSGLSHTFSQCYNLVNVVNIPESATNMSGTFEWCSNLTGDIYIESENVLDAFNCFGDTSLQKNVYIPFHTSEITYKVYHYWYNSSTGEYLYILPDYANKTQMYADASDNFGVYDSSQVEYTNIEHLSYTNWGTPFIDLTFTNGETLQYYANSSNNIEIELPIGSNTQTYDAFIAAGYDDAGTQDGVYLKDINGGSGTEVDVSNFNYTLNDGILRLTKYIGSDTDVEIPNINNE